MNRRLVASLLLVSLLGTLICARPAAAQFTPDEQLMNAVTSGDVNGIHAALKAGADLNADIGRRRTPLIAAVMFGKPESVKALLEMGADPRKEADDGAIGNALTAAFFAMNGVALTGMGERPEPRKHAEALEVLRLVAASKVDKNFLVRRAGTQQTALMIAADAGVLDAVQVLLAAGADPNAMNGGKYTALDYAVDRAPRWSTVPASDRVAVVKALLAAGAKKNRKGADGVLPIDRAKRAGNAEIVALLSAG